MNFLEILNKLKSCFVEDTQVKVFNDCIQSLIAEDLVSIEVNYVEIIRKYNLSSNKEVIFDVRLKGVKKE